MSEIRFELEREDPTYRPGEPIRGRVVVGARAEPLESLDLTLAWASRPADDDPGVVLPAGGRVSASHRLLDRPAPAGAWELALPFAVPCPDGPGTHESGHVRVDWELRATARFSRGAREAAIAFQLEEARDTVARAERRAPARDRRLSRIRRETLGQALAWIGLGAGLIALAVWLESGPCLAACGLPGLLVCLAGLLALRNPLAERRLGPVRLDLPAEVALGEPLVLFLSFCPPGRLRLEAIQVRLSAVASGAQRTDTRTLHEHTARPELPALVRREGLRLRVELPIPPEAAPSSAGVQWGLQVRIELPRWPDWTIHVPLRVVAPGGPLVPRLSLEVQPGQRCPYCRERVAAPEASSIRPCAGCGAVLHDACWAELGRCPSAGCGAPARDPRRTRE